MRAGFDLPDWNSLASLEGDTLPLLGTALLIARDEYPQLDANLYDTLLQSHAEHLRGEIEAIDAWPMKMQAINRHLFEELGYKGNHDEYYDPRNSYLNEVFERRLGNPVSLAMVQMEVARRLGVPLDGVSFPGHFLVRLPIDDGVLVISAPRNSSLGVKGGDVVLAVDGRRPEGPLHLIRILRSYDGGEPFKLEILRSRKRETLTGSLTPPADDR